MKNKIEGLRDKVHDNVNEPIDQQVTAGKALANQLIMRSEIGGWPFYIIDVIIGGFAIMGYFILPGIWSIFSGVAAALFLLHIPKDFNNYKQYQYDRREDENK